METILIDCPRSKREERSTITVQTTLYDLMETVIDVVGPDEKQFVKDVTLNLLTKAKARFLIQTTK